MALADRARGRWPEILRSLLGEEFVSRKHGPCPVSGEGDDRFRFSDHEGAGRYFCSCSDGSGSGFDLIMCAKGCDFAEAARLVESVIGKDAHKPREDFSWIEDALERSCYSRYLEGRGLEVPPGIRFARSLFCPIDAKKHPAMVGRLGSAYHVTYVANGGKAFDNPRRIFGSPTGAIELYPAAEEMGIAEGIETAIAAKMLTGIPTHAAGNTALMKKWRAPKCCKVVHVFADWDENFAGHAAAYALAHRLVASQSIPVVTVRFPEKPGDFADMISVEQRQAS